MTGIHKLIVFTEPVIGREDEYNKWYDEVHLPEVLATEGFVSAQRFKIADAQMDNMDSGVPARYLAIYDMEGDQIGPILSALAAGADKMNMSEALDVTDAKAWAFSAIGEKQAG